MGPSSGHIKTTMEKELYKDQLLTRITAWAVEWNLDSGFSSKERDSTLDLIYKCASDPEWPHTLGPREKGEAAELESLPAQLSPRENNRAYRGENSRIISKSINKETNSSQR